MICPGPVTVVPPTWTLAIPSGAITVMVPEVLSASVCEAVPGDSLGRTGKPVSLTTVPAAPTGGSETTEAGLSSMVMVSFAVSLLPSLSVSV